MSAFPTTDSINNLNTDGLVNPDSSGVSSFLFTSTKIPDGPHTLSELGSESLSIQKGGKINRKKINKISRKYKMKSSKRHIKRMKSRLRSKYSKRLSKRHNKTRRHKTRYMRGGNVSPNYPAGYSQYQNNNGGLSNTYSLGGVLPPNLSALANPAPYQKMGGETDNLNHYKLNSYGNSGAGSGFASRGWF